MGKAVAVDGCEIKDVTGGGTVKITSQPSSKDEAGGKGIYFGPLTFTVSGSNGGGSIGDSNGSGGGQIAGTGTKICDAAGNPAVLLDDEVTITVKGTTTSGSSTSPASGSITVKITKAGQDKVIAL